MQGRQGQNIFFWYGSDDFTMLELLGAEKQAMRQKNRNADINDFDFGGDASRSEMEIAVRGSLRGSSLFSSDKLTVVRDFWSSARKRKSAAGKEGEEGQPDTKKKAGFEEFLLGAMQGLGERDRLYLIETRDLDKRGKAHKLVEQLAAEGRLDKREFAMPVGFMFNRWLEERLKARGGRMDKADLDFFAMLLGKGAEQKEHGELIAAYDLWQADNELEKLITYTGGDIRREDILLLVCASADMNIFDLIESIARHDRSRALELLSGQIAHGYNENYILSMLVYHFRNLIGIRSLLDESLGAAEIARRMRIHPMVAEKNLKSARSFTPSQLALIYDKLYSADLGIKTGRMDPELALDLLVAAI